MNVIAKISCYFDSSVVTLKLRKEHLNTVIDNRPTPVLLQIKRWTVWYYNAILCQHIFELQTFKKQSGFLAHPVQLVTWPWPRPFEGRFVIDRLGHAMVNLPTKFEVPNFRIFPEYSLSRPNAYLLHIWCTDVYEKRLAYLVIIHFRVSSINYSIASSFPIHTRSSANAEGPRAHCQLKSCTRAHQEIRYPNVTWRIILSVYLFTTELRHTCSSRIFF